MNYTALEAWNRSVIQSLTPSIVMIVLYCILGVIGNMTVFVVYKKRLISGNGRFFIPVLACVDFSASFVCSICVLIRLYFNVTFFSDILCRCLFFIICWNFSISIFIVLAIAYDRYRMVCQINRRQLTEKQKWNIVRMILIIGVVINCPVLATTGNVFVNTHSENNYSIQGSVCVFSTHLYPTFETAHSIFVIFLALTIFFCVMVFNIKIAYIVCIKLRSSKTFSNLYNKPENKESFSTEENLHSATGSICQLKQIADITKCNADENEDGGNMSFNNKLQLSNEQLEDDSNIKNEHESLKICPEKKSKDELQIMQVPIDKSRSITDNSLKSKYRLKAFTRHHSASIHVMFFVMFIVMLLAYIPSLIILVVVFNNRRENSWWVFVEENDLNVNIYILLKTSYLMSNAANPYIYSLFDKKFRKVLIGFVKCKFKM